MVNCSVSALVREVKVNGLDSEISAPFLIEISVAWPGSYL